MFFWLIRSKHVLQALSISQLKQFILGLITQSLLYFLLPHFKQPCFLCGILIPSNVLVQSIENLPDTVFPSDNDMYSSSFIIICCSEQPFKVRLAEITPKSSTTRQYFVFGPKNHEWNMPELLYSFLPSPSGLPTKRFSKVDQFF